MHFNLENKEQDTLHSVWAFLQTKTYFLSHEIVLECCGH